MEISAAERHKLLLCPLRAFPKLKKGTKARNAALRFQSSRHQRFSRTATRSHSVLRWGSLHHDVQQKIFEQLPISDLHNARLAGLDQQSSHLRQSIRHLMRKRCTQLYPLWNEWKSSSRFKSRVYRNACDPVRFTTVKAFAACHCNISSMAHLWHFRDLKRLNIKFCSLFRPQLHHFESALRGCPGLLRLNISACPYEYFPKAILALKKLRYLGLSRTPFLTQRLPHDMGEHLPHLQVLDLSHCIWVTSIPDSVLTRLENYRKQLVLSGKNIRHSCLKLEGCELEQRQKLVSADRYPFLAGSV